MVFPTLKSKIRRCPEQHTLEVETDPAGARESGGIDSKPVAQVEHGCGPGERCSWPISNRRMRRELRPGLVAQSGCQFRRRLPRSVHRILKQQSKRDGGLPEHPGYGNDVPYPRPGTQHGIPPFEVTESRHRKSERGRDRQVAADNAAARGELRTGIPKAVRDALQQRDRRVCWRGYSDNKRCCHRTHCGDIRKVGDRSLPAEVMRGRPGKPKVGSVNHHVCRHHEAPVWSGNHGGVIAWSKQGGCCGRQPRKYALQRRRFPDPAQGVCIARNGRPVSICHASNGSLKVMNPRSARVTSVALVPVLLALLSACAPVVALTPAADATNPKCAEVIVHLPGAVADQSLRQTDAQATGAWGDPAAVVLRCGVTPPGPTSTQCATVKGIDWLIDNTKKPVYTFTTYGRTPAVQVIIDSQLTQGQGTIVLDQLSNAVSFITQSRQHKCESVVGEGLGGQSKIAPGSTPAP
jgi:hypothetical protein